MVAREAKLELKIRHHQKLVSTKAAGSENQTGINIICFRVMDFSRKILFNYQTVLLFILTATFERSKILKIGLYVIALFC